jgi:Secretion system C-terminal sorting domain
VIPYPSVNQLIVLNGGSNPPVLSGTDPEDYPGGGVLNTRSLIIDTIPNNAELQYNNVPVTNGQLISNFTPALLKVKITPATMGSASTTFRYSYVDAANMKDPSPATYTLLWVNTLPAEALVALVNLNGNIATVKWSTASEQNTDHFVLERSLDNNSYTAIGNTVAAAGNSSSKKEYQQPDNISSLTQNTVIYYRVKLVDIDGKSKYSNVVVLRLSQKPGVTIWPNPFQSSITISITTEKATTIDINLIDVGGRTIRQSSQSVEKGITRVSIDGLEQLPAGVYLVEINDKKAGTTYQKVLKNDK